MSIQFCILLSDSTSAEDHYLTENDYKCMMYTDWIIDRNVTCYYLAPLIFDSVQAFLFSLFFLVRRPFCNKFREIFPFILASFLKQIAGSHLGTKCFPSQPVMLCQRNVLRSRRSVVRLCVEVRELMMLQSWKWEIWFTCCPPSVLETRTAANTFSSDGKWVCSMWFLSGNYLI